MTETIVSKNWMRYPSPRRRSYPYADSLAFHDLHDGRPPWDTGAPQPALLALTKAGELRGRVLDIGCGTGEHTLMAAAAGLDATGIDLAAGALEAGARKALERGLTARFLCHDALRLSDLGESFDTALDSLLLHALDPAVRAGYLSGVRAVLRPAAAARALLQRPAHGDPDLPHKMSRAELASCFTSGWDLESLQATTCATNLHPGGAAAWLATCRRT